MKKSCLAAVICLLLTLALLVPGCTPGGPDDPSADDAWHVNTGKFNEGVVEYSMNQEVTYKDPFDTAGVGSLMAKKDKGVEELMSVNFKDGDVLAGGLAVCRDKSMVGIENKTLYFPYDENSSNHFANAWTTWAPVVECFDPEYYQAQITLTCTLYSVGQSNWEAPMVGLYKSDVGSIADNPSDGMYLAFNPNTGNITVYAAGADNWAWPAGNATVTVDKALMQGSVKLIILATQDKRVFVYLGDVLCLSLAVSGEKVTVSDGSGNQVYTGAIDTDLLNGTYMSIFCHQGGFGLTKMNILTATKGTKQVKSEFTATPVGDHKLGLDITDKTDLVSICYSCWFNAINGSGTAPIGDISNVSELLEDYKFSSAKGFYNDKGETKNSLTKFHYWAKPAQGYYRSTDAKAAENNMRLLYNAGVDFIIIDFTYATDPDYAPGTNTWNTYIYGPVCTLLDTIMEMRSRGEGTPYVVFWMGRQNMFPHMQKYFLNEEKWKDCFVYWDNKPFIMSWSFNIKTDHYDDLTVRGMYGLQGKVYEGMWSYLEVDNTDTVCYDADGKAEHVCADVATQETYMSASTAHGRQGGRFWNQQWKTAFDVHPKIVTVTWWNEWCAQLYKFDGVGYVFTDNFNQEFSRDIEPMEGGHGDQYYQWLIRYIYDYKNGKPCPELIEE